MLTQNAMVPTPERFHEKEVRAGMAWLDVEAPGWENRLNLGRLNVRECTSCVLGQLTGGGGRWVEHELYDKARKVEGNTSSESNTQYPENLGFSLLAPEAHQYDQLTWTWKALVQERREEIAALQALKGE